MAVGSHGKGIGGDGLGSHRPPSNKKKKKKNLINKNEEDEMEVVGYQRVAWLNAVVVLCCVLTLGFLRLIFYWKPEWMLLSTHTPCPLNIAQKVLLKDQHKQYFVESVEVITHDGIRVSIHRPSKPTLGKMKEFTAYHCSTSSDEEAIQQQCSLIKYFVNKKLKYLWSDTLRTFIKLGGLESDVSYYSQETYSNKPVPATCNFFHAIGSLSSAKSAKLRVFYGLNSIPVHVKPVVKLVLEQVLTPFYIFQFGSIILWFYEVYFYYAICLLVISVFSIGLTVYTTRQMQRSLKSTVQGFDFIKVKRDGDWLSLRSELLVPGDVIEISCEGCTMQCDAVLLSGNCIVNESMLTGESVPIIKTPLPPNKDDSCKLDMKNHSRHILFCGTNVIQTRHLGNQVTLAVVIRTGFLTSKGELVRSIMFPKPIDFKFYKDMYKFIGFLSACAIIGMTYTLTLKILRGETVSSIVLRTLDLISTCVPAVLPATLTMGTVMAQSRLKHKHIFCIQPSSINIAGTVNVVCFDKTGTLTEDGLDIWGILPVCNKRFLQAIRSTDNLENDHAVYCMATCHSLTVIGGNLCGDPLDLKMFESTRWSFDENASDSSFSEGTVTSLVRPPTDGSVSYVKACTLGIVRQFTFSSSLQRMSVVVRYSDGRGYGVYAKGSPEMISSLSQPDTVPPDFFGILAEYATRGCRVIGLAYRHLDVSPESVASVERETIEKDLQFLGLLIMENRLKPETIGAISELTAARIRTVMVTGDNMLTGLSVARGCGMLDFAKRAVLVTALPPTDVEPPTLDFHAIDDDCMGRFDSQASIGTCKVDLESSAKGYCFAVTGKSWAVLRKHFPDVLNKIVVRGAVFARMAPEQKTQLIETLQSVGYYVGMCGDGANDCGALKAAHAGISLSEAEASIASPFTSKEPNVSCVPRLVKEGRAALVTSFGIFKMVASYSLNEFVSVMLLYWINSNLTDFEYLYQDLILIAIFSISFGRTPASTTLHVRPPMVSLSGFQPVFSMLLVTAISAGVQVFSYYWVQMQPWFEPFHNLGDGNYASYENVAIFNISMFQLTALVVMFSKGSPYRKTIFRNYFLLANVVVVLCMNTWIVLYPLPFMVDLLALRPPPVIEFRMALLALALGNVVFFILLDMVFLEAPWFRDCLRYCKRRSCKASVHSPHHYSHIERYMSLREEDSTAEAWPPYTEAGLSRIADVLQREALPAEPAAKEAQLAEHDILEQHVASRLLSLRNEGGGKKNARACKQSHFPSSKTEYKRIRQSEQRGKSSSCKCTEQAYCKRLGSSCKLMNDCPQYLGCQRPDQKYRLYLQPPSMTTHETSIEFECHEAFYDPPTSWSKLQRSPES